jgi:hypothetical protein
VGLVFLAVNDRIEEASTLADEIAANATDAQRRANAIRLAALRRRADIPALDRIVAILQRDPSQTSTS